MKEEIRAKDPTGSGFIDPDVLYAILVKKCIPLTFQDFRFLTQQVTLCALCLYIIGVDVKSFPLLRR